MTTFFKALKQGDADALRRLLAEEGLSESHRYLGIPAQKWAAWVVPGVIPGHPLPLLTRKNETSQLEFLTETECIETFGFTSISQQHLPGLWFAKFLIGYARFLIVFGLNRFISMKYSQELEDGLTSSKSARLALSRLEDPFGYGVVALESLSAGTVITEYLGLVKCEHKLSVKEDTTYVMEYPLPAWLGWVWTIDARVSGNIARFINHSRRPNAEMKVFYDGQVMRLAIIARRHIKVGEQISLNYGSNYWQSRQEHETGFK